MERDDESKNLIPLRAVAMDGKTAPEGSGAVSWPMHGPGGAMSDADTSGADQNSDSLLTEALMLPAASAITRRVFESKLISVSRRAVMSALTRTPSSFF